MLTRINKEQGRKIYNELKESCENLRIDGYTYYYIKDIEKNKYMASISINKEKLPFIEVGSVITISYQKTDNEVNVIQKIK